ncbi:Phosphatidylinositol 4-kinase pik1alpha (PI4-kinase)(PtdIns-4-kinase) [Rhizoclosmatium sp. JEL0117]|nr:Phosphatidylinositol 4-kinase pik1alpha (PI4-kinase)(PtdIns-4-kinase) [Rhizoclosmatium hyalinum]KAJ3288931.1 Phosphatidylinositol 4-kinase pik1alpha (PI4-kinase)(PtdIns-4-kinase) [Rhizoclosmatium sp. JEL0117]
MTSSGEPVTTISAEHPQIGSWLMRLFQSDFFDARLALHYLHLYPNNEAIQAYICNAFRSFPEADCEFWLPQILHILITRGGADIESFIIDRAMHSDHMAILTLWHLQTYLNQGHLSSTNPNAQELLHRVYQRTQFILFGKGTSTSLAASPAVDDTAIIQSISPVAQSIATIKPSSAPQSRKRSDNLDRTISPESEGSSAGFYKIETSHIENVSLAGDVLQGDDDDSPSASLSNSLSSTGNDGATAEGHDYDPMKESVVIVRGSGPGMTSEAFGRGSVAFDGEHKFASSIGFPMSAPTIEEMGMGTAFNRSVRFVSTTGSQSHSRGTEGMESGRPSDLEWMMVNKPDYTYFEDPRMRYFHSQLQFIMTLSDISDRLRSVPKPNRQSALFAELSLLNHNLPANVCIPLWCSGGTGEKNHHWVVRVPPNDGVTLNSADRVPYLLILEIVDDVDNELSSDEALSKRLSINSNAQTPTIARLKPDLLDPQEARPSSSSLNALDLGENSEPNAEYYKTVQNRRNHMSPAASTEKQGSGEESSAPIVVKTPPRPIGQSRSTSSSSLALTAANTAVDEYTQKMRTAAVMLAQLYQQQAGAPSGTSSPSGSNSPSPHRKSESGTTALAGAAASGGGMKVDFEAIRHRLVQEMSVLEEKRLKAMEEQRAAEHALESEHQAGSVETGGDSSALNSSGDGSDEAVPEGIDTRLHGELFKKDKDDPSAAVFKESWDAKCARIRASSPYGKNPSWKLMSVIVKSGSDLRQEVLALQLIKEMQRIWKEENVPVWVHYYRVLVTSKDGGLIETVQNAISVHSIKKDGYNQNLNQPGVAYSLYDYFIQEFGAPASKKFLKAQDAFMRSLAGYSVVCYLLQIKDRHNGNILVDKEGHTIHIDFGFMLSNSPGNMGFELAPFKLPQEFVDILGGTRSLKFQQYRKLCKDAFIAVRKRWDLIVGLVEIMEKDSVLPCFTGTSVKPGQAPTVPTPTPAASTGLFGGFFSAEQPSSSSSSPYGSSQSLSGGGKPVSVGSNPALPVSMKLKERFSLGMTEPQVMDYVDRLVDSSINSIMTRLYDAFQWYSNGVL